MISPLTARYLREILQAALGDQLTIPIPEPTAVMAVEQLQKNLAQLGALAAIALAMGSVSGRARSRHGGARARPAGDPDGVPARPSSPAIAIVLGDLRRASRRSSAWVYTARPVRAPAGRRLGGDGAPVLARTVRLGGADVPRLGRHRARRRAAAGLGFVALVVISLGAIVPALDRLLPTGPDGPGDPCSRSGEAGLDAGRACDRRRRDGRPDRRLPRRMRLLAFRRREL